MIPEEVSDLLEQRNTAIVGINRPTNGPQLSPVWYLWDGHAFYFRVATSTAKYRNIKRNPSISLFVHDELGFKYIAAYGEAEILATNPPDIAAQIVRRYYAPSLAPHRMPPDVEPDVVTIKLIPEKVVSVIEDAAREAAYSWM